MNPGRGEIWLADFDPVRGHEQSGRRPVLVVSVDEMNSGKSSLVIVVPLTTKHRGIESHRLIRPPEGGLVKPSYLLVEAIRSISRERLVVRWGVVSPATMFDVEIWLKTLLGIR